MTLTAKRSLLPMNQYDADQTDANWELVKTAFVDGWAVQYQAANG